MKRKIVSVFLVVALAIGMLMTTTVMAQSKLTLRFTNWFQAEIDRLGLVPLVEEFERINNVKIENLIWSYREVEEMLLRSVITGELEADMSGADFNRHALLLDKAGLIEHTNDWLEANPDIYNLAPPGIWDAYTNLDGNILGWLYNTHATALAYNEKSFARAGIDPGAVVSWEKFLDVAKKFTVDTDGDGEPDTYGFMGRATSPTASWRDFFADWAMGNGGEFLVREQGRWIPAVMSEEVLEAGQFISDLMFKDEVMPKDMMGWGDKDAMRLIGEGNGGFYQAYSSLGMWFEEGGAFPGIEWQDDIRGMVVPKGPMGIRPVSTYEAGGWVIAKNISEEKKAMAYKFMKWMILNSDKAYGAQSAYTPGLKAYAEIAPVYADYAYIVPTYGKSAGYKLPQMGALTQLVGTAVQKLLAEDQDVSEVFKQLEKEIIKVIAAL